MIKLLTYLFLIYSSELIVLYQAFRILFKKNILATSITFWFLIRLISEVISYFVKFKFHLNVNPVFHISVLLEGILMVWFFIQMNNKPKNKYWIYCIPLLSFYFEVKYSGSIYNSNGISFMVYNLISSILMLISLINENKIDEFSRTLVKALFILHSVSFIYSIIENVIRINDTVMQIVYPVFLFSHVVFNVFISYYLWLARKN